MSIDDEVIRLHQAGSATGAIALRLGVPSSHVRNVVTTHRMQAAEAAKPHYNIEAAKRKAAAKAKVAKAQQALDAAAAILAGLED